MLVFRRVLLTAVLIVTQLQAASLLFKTGFESSSALGPTSNDGNMQAGSNSTMQMISGVDNSTGFDWSTVWGLYGSTYSGLHLIPGNGMDGQPFANAFKNALDTTVKHSGAQSLKLNATGFTNPNCSGACGQITWEINGDLRSPNNSAASLNEQYERVWVYLPSSLKTQAQAAGSDYEMFFEFKSSNNHRWGTYVYYNSGVNNNNLYWHTQIDTLTDVNPTQTFYCGTDFGSPVNTSVPVPLNQWFMMEFYFKLATGASRFYWGLTDPAGVNHTLFDITSSNSPNCAGFSPVTGSGEHILGLFEMNNYADRWPILRWIDDLEIWDTAPCGAVNLPCGPGASPTPISPPGNFLSTAR